MLLTFFVGKLNSKRIEYKDFIFIPLCEIIFSVEEFFAPFIFNCAFSFWQNALQNKIIATVGNGFSLPIIVND